MITLAYKVYGYGVSVHTIVSHWFDTIEWRAIEVCGDRLKEKKLGHYSRF